MSAVDVPMHDANHEFKISTSLGGHDYGLRDIAVASSDLFLILETKGKIKFWVRDSNAPRLFQPLTPSSPEFHDKHHISLTMVATCLRGVPGYPEGKPLFITGGGDKVARPILEDGTTPAPLIGHTNSVNSISQIQSGDIITGGWDGQARIWSRGTCTAVLEGHEHACEVLGLPSGEIITGSANKHIFIIRNNKIEVPIREAHDHAIRKLIAHPQGFASCGNDGFIKIWSLRGKLIQKIEAHTSESKFVYGLCLLPGDQLASCGEDGHVNIWSSDGKHLQTLIHPGPVWNVKALPNGDLVTACTDRIARIFTRAPERYASDADLAEYEEMVNLVKISGMQSLDASQIHEESKLHTPGKRDGEVMVCQIPARGAIAYQWSEAQQKWNEVGEAIGKSSRKTLNGKEYDFVTEVYITETQKVQLGFNRDDDPEEVAAHFCAIYNLAPYLRPQIVDHVKPMTDPLLYKKRKEREAAEAAKVALRHLPSWRVGGLEMYSQCNIKAMRTKLLEFNTELKTAGNPHILTDSDMKSFNLLMTNIGDASNFHIAPFTDVEREVTKKMLQWPSDKILPVLDAYRMLMVQEAAVNSLGSDGEAQRLVLGHASGGTDTHLVLVLKIFSNWLAKRRKSPFERDTSKPHIPESLSAFLMEMMDTLSVATTSQSENVVTAYIMLVNNIISWLGRMNIQESDLYPIIASGVCGLLEHKQKARVLFFGMVALGSMGLITPAVRDMIKESFGEQLESLVKLASTQDDRSVQEVGSDLSKVYGYSK